MSLENHAYCIECFEAAPGQREQLHAELVALAKLSRIEPGCLQYDVTQDEANLDHFILILKYTDKPAMAAHEQQDYVVEFVETKMNELCQSVKWWDASGCY